MGEAGKDAVRVGVDRAIKLAFYGARVSPDAGLFPCRDPSVRGCVMGVDRQCSNRPIGHADRCLDARADGIQAVVVAERLGFLGAISWGPRSPKV